MNTEKFTSAIVLGVGSLRFGKIDDKIGLKLGSGTTSWNTFTSVVSASWLMSRNGVGEMVIDSSIDFSGVVVVVLVVDVVLVVVEVVVVVTGRFVVVVVALVVDVVVVGAAVVLLLVVLWPVSVTTFGRTVVVATSSCGLIVDLTDVEMVVRLTLFDVLDEI
jgi:hypothetical protein